MQNLLMSSNNKAHVFESNAPLFIRINQVFEHHDKSAGTYIIGR